jgi:hypothetical protein
MFVIAEHGREHIQHRLLHDAAAERLTRQLPAPGDMGGALLQNLFGLGSQAGRVQPLRQVMGVEGEQYRGRGERVQGRGSIEQFLHVLPVIVLVGGDGNPPAQAGDADCRMQMRQGGGAEQSQPNRVGDGPIGRCVAEAATQGLVQRRGS